MFASAVSVMSKKDSVIFYCWAAYTSLLAVLVFFSLPSLLSGGAVEIIDVVVGVFGLIGLYGFVVKKCYFSQAFRRLVFVVTVCLFVYSAADFELVRRTEALPLSSYGDFVFFFPQLYALYQYAGFSGKRT